jgi:hypothetical protein
MGRFGHEFLGTISTPTAFVPSGLGLNLRFAILMLTWTIEFDFRVVGDGRSAVARYANNSNYRNDSLIRKESKDTLYPTPKRAPRVAFV